MDMSCDAARFQVKCLTCKKPSATSAVRREESAKSAKIVSDQASTSAGGKVTAASPTTSGSEEAFEVMTGTPQAMASNKGRPNPSYKLGNTNNAA
jgi:hypothetical protein